MSKVIGVDLGTTNSCVAILEGGEPKIIENAEGLRTTPSVVAITEEREWLIGQVPKRQAITNPENTIFSIKRFMGRQYSEIVEESNKVPYQVSRNRNGDAWVCIASKLHAPPEISAHILQKMKETVERHLGQSVTQAVITVPAYFNDAQRQATKDAGTIAGLKVLRIINEPTAAALAYGLDRIDRAKIAVYDLGGGTFDISILEIGNGLIEVLSTNGDTHLGGDDFDQAIIDWLVEGFKINSEVNLNDDAMAIQRLKEAAEKAKCELSSTLKTEINLPFIIAASTDGAKHLNISLSRSRLEQLTIDLIERSIAPCHQALKDAGIKPKEIDEVVLVGGQTRMPKVQEMVKKIFGKEAKKGVNPDEVVAIGASVQGAILSGDQDVKDILLLDVTPLSLGIETLGGIFTRLIDRNTTIPARQSKTFTTAEDNQSSVDIHVLQGERQQANYNKTIGRFHLDGLPAAPRNSPQIDVGFDIDANGILSVSARDMATGNEQKIAITTSSGLSNKEIQQMIQDAEANIGEDEFKRKEFEIRHKAETLIYETKKKLSVLDDKLDLLVKSDVESAVVALQQALERKVPLNNNSNIELIHSQMDLVLQIWQKLWTNFYVKDDSNEQSVNFVNANYYGISRNDPADISRDHQNESHEEFIDADYEVVDNDDRYFNRRN